MRKERAIVSEIQLDSAAMGTGDPDAETGKADEVSDYSEEADGFDPAGPSDDVAEPAEDGLDAAEDSAAEDSAAEDDADAPEDETEDSAPDAQEEFMRELRMLPGDWYVVHSYAGYENRVKTNLESRIQSLNMEDYIFQIEVPVHMVTEIKSGKRQQVSEKVLPGYILVRMDLTDESWAVVRNTPGVTGFVGLSSRPSPLQLSEVASLLAPEPEPSEKQAEAARTSTPDHPGLRGRRVVSRDGRAVRHPARHGERDQPGHPEAQGAGVDLRPRDARRAFVRPGNQDLSEELVTCRQEGRGCPPSSRCSCRPARPPRPPRSVPRWARTA